MATRCSTAARSTTTAEHRPTGRENPRPDRSIDNASSPKEGSGGGSPPSRPARSPTSLASRPNLRSGSSAPWRELSVRRPAPRSCHAGDPHRGGCSHSRSFPRPIERRLRLPSKAPPATNRHGDATEFAKPSTATFRLEGAPRLEAPRRRRGTDRPSTARGAPPRAATWRRNRGAFSSRRRRY